MGEWIRKILDLWEAAFWHLVWAAYYWVTFQDEKADAEFQYFSGKLQTIYQMVSDKAAAAYDNAVDWAAAAITTVKETIGSVWDSITSIWSQFGAALLDGYWTVVSWVEDKVTGVTDWVQSNYDAAKADAINAWGWVTDTGANIRDWVMDKGATAWDWIDAKASTVWDWIGTKADYVWDWITDFVSPVTDWIQRYIDFYMSLFDNYSNMLLTFLEDPETFIADRVADSLERIIATAIKWYW